MVPSRIRLCSILVGEVLAVLVFFIEGLPQGIHTSSCKLVMLLTGALSVQDANWPKTLAQVCNIIRINDIDPNKAKVCQAFVYDSNQKVAFFKGQPANQSIDPTHLCYSPNSTLWLNAGQLLSPAISAVLHTCIAYSTERSGRSFAASQWYSISRSDSANMLQCADEFDGIGFLLK